MRIPVKYNNCIIGEVVQFNKDTGEVSIQLDLNRKEQAKILKAMIVGNCPISMSFRNEPCNPKPYHKLERINNQNSGATDEGN